MALGGQHPGARPGAGDADPRSGAPRGSAPALGPGALDRLDLAVGAQCGLGPRRRADPGGAGRRPLGAQRDQALGGLRQGGRLHRGPGPHPRSGTRRVALGRPGTVPGAQGARQLPAGHDRPGDRQDRLPRLPDLRTHPRGRRVPESDRLTGLYGDQGADARFRRVRVRPAGPQHRPGPHGGARGRRGAGGRGGQPGLPSGAGPVRASDRRLPGAALRPRRHGRRGRAGAGLSGSRRPTSSIRARPPRASWRW